jgi:Flp pilus assembly protein TadG
MQRQCRERGQNLAELALVLPLLIILFLGIADLGRAFHAFIVVENAAREAARYAASYPDDLDGARARARAEAANLPGIQLVGDPQVQKLSGGGDTFIRARVEHQFTLITGSLLGLGPITLTGTADMRVLTGGT